MTKLVRLSAVTVKKTNKGGGDDWSTSTAHRLNLLKTLTMIHRIRERRLLQFIESIGIKRVKPGLFDSSK